MDPDAQVASVNRSLQRVSDEYFCYANSIIAGPGLVPCELSRMETFSRIPIMVSTSHFTAQHRRDLCRKGFFPPAVREQGRC